ncbi:MAG: radical SAM family heme chaperone HemW [Pseudomonadota bacterium]
MSEDWQNGGFGLYLHWPFCEAKCPYCDFNSHVSREIDHKAWRDAYVKEVERAARNTPDRVLSTVFLGGGTPSLMAPETVADVLDKIRSLWPVANDLEVTLEANPTSVEAGRFRDFRQAGVNRVSMGIQALNDHDLKKLGRLHSARDAMNAFETARNTFERVSFDLIYGRQNQTLEDWEAELRQALNLAIDHISLYQLTIEKGTAFGERYKRGRLQGLPNEDLGADLYQVTQDICEDMGMHRYEVSNHARDGAQSRHNLVYWRYGDYLGIGPGAHGRITQNGTRWATEGHKNPWKWLQTTAEGQAEKPRVEIDRSEQLIEFLLMGLRIEEGICIDRYQKLSGQDPCQQTLDHLQEIGMIQISRNRISVSNQGFMVLNAVIEALIPSDIPPQ